MLDGWTQPRARTNSLLPRSPRYRVLCPYSTGSLRLVESGPRLRVLPLQPSRVSRLAGGDYEERGQCEIELPIGYGEGVRSWRVAGEGSVGVLGVMIGAG